MTEAEIRQLTHLLSSAVEAAYTEPDLLVKSDGSPREGNEQTVAFRVGIHLHELRKGTQYQQFHLDCEYNKHGDDPKERPDGSMRPDLLIHCRGNDEHNMLAAEFVGWWKIKRHPAKVEEDRDKLRELTSPEYTYQYQLGVLVKLNIDNAAYEYFRNGRMLKL